MPPTPTPRPRPRPRAPPRAGIADDDAEEEGEDAEAGEKPATDATPPPPKATRREMPEAEDKSILVALPLPVEKWERRTGERGDET